jgi:hypothetical protein
MPAQHFTQDFKKGGTMKKIYLFLFIGTFFLFCSKNPWVSKDVKSQKHISSINAQQIITDISTQSSEKFLESNLKLLSLTESFATFLNDKDLFSSLVSNTPPILFSSFKFTEFFHFFQKFHFAIQRY